MSGYQFYRYLRKMPRDALLCRVACKRMTDRQFNSSVLNNADIALNIEHVCARLSDDQFKIAVAALPALAIANKHSCDRLDDQSFLEIAEQYLQEVFTFEHSTLRYLNLNTIAF